MIGAYILFVLFAIFLWFSLYKLFKPLGGYLLNKYKKAINEMKDE